MSAGSEPSYTTNYVCKTEMYGTTYNLRLWCLVEGEKIPFTVIPSSNISIAELKEVIKAKSPFLQSVHALRLTLWKVPLFLVIYSDIMGDASLA